MHVVFNLMDELRVKAFGTTTTIPYLRSTDKEYRNSMDH